MKKLLNPLVVSVFIIVLLLGSVGHLMYGSCQTSKWHYMCQAYWMPENLPEWMLGKFSNLQKLIDAFDDDESSEILIITYISDENHSGTWTEWFKNGNKKSLETFMNGKRVGEYLRYFEDGQKIIEGKYSNDGSERSIGKWIYYHLNGNKKSVMNFKYGNLVSKEEWNQDGILSKKEYYDK